MNSLNQIAAYSTEKKYQVHIKSDEFNFYADEPLSIDGDNTGPTPMQYLSGALGGCIMVTLKMYAERKGWDLGPFQVDVWMERESKETIIKKKITFEKEIPEDQLKRLHVISSKCPVSKLIAEETKVDLIDG